MNVIDSCGTRGSLVEHVVERGAVVLTEIGRPLHAAEHDAPRPSTAPSMMLREVVVRLR